MKRRASEPHRQQVPRPPIPSGMRPSRSLRPVRARRRRLPVPFACGSYLPALRSLRRPKYAGRCAPLGCGRQVRLRPHGSLAAPRDRQLRAIALPLSALGGLPRRPATFALPGRRLLTSAGQYGTPVLPPRLLPGWQLASCPKDGFAT